MLWLAWGDEMSNPSYIVVFWPTFSIALLSNRWRPTNCGMFGLLPHVRPLTRSIFTEESCYLSNLKEIFGILISIFVFDWNFEDSNPILRWDDPILVLIIFTGSFAGWPLSEHHINWRKLKTKRHGRARSWWWKILSAVRHHLYLLQTKILFALRRQIPYFAKDKQTSTARNVTA